MKRFTLLACLLPCLATVAAPEARPTDSPYAIQPRAGQMLQVPADLAAFAADLENAPYRPVEVITRGEQGDTLYRYVYAYDKEGKDLGATGPCIVRNHQKWDAEARQFINDVRFRAILDENGDMTLYYMDKGVGQHWENDYRFVATYNTNHDQVTASQEDWVDNAWFSKLRWENEYDSEGRLISQTYQNRYTGNEWVQGSRYIWEYDENGNETKYEMQTLQGGDEYKPLVSELCTYDDRNNMLTRTLQANSVNSMKYTYTYNEVDSCILSLTETWNRTENVWYAQVCDTFIFTQGKDTAIRRVPVAPAPTSEAEWVYKQKTVRLTTATATMETSYDYAPESGEWLDKKRIIDSWAQAQQHVWSEDTFDIDTQKYVTINRIITTYDEDNNVVEYKLQTNVGEEKGEDGTPFLNVFAYTNEYDGQGNAVKVQASKKGEKDAIILPYNNSLNQWGCPEFDSWSAEATYMDLNEYVMPTGVTFAEPEVELAVGDTLRLTAEVQPAEASIKDIHWLCDDEAIALVSVDGELTALAEGTTTVRAITLEGRVEGTIAVRVTPASHLGASTAASLVTCTANRLTVHGDGIRQVRIYAVGGQLQAWSDAQFTFDTQAWTPGVYFVQVVQHGHTYMQKVVVR